MIPFAQIFANASPENAQKALEDVKSVEYRKMSFQLALIGDEKVVLEWNKLWQALFALENEEERQPDFILYLGDVLLAIRKALGAERTNLSNKDMLRWLIKDIDSI